MKDKIVKEVVDKPKKIYEPPRCKTIIYKGGLRMGCSKDGSGALDFCNCGFQFCLGTIS